jgi:Bromodomain
MVDVTCCSSFSCHSLIEGVYQNVEEFASDCRLVIENCRTFYGGREDGRLFIDHADQLNKVLSQQLDAFDRYLKSPPGLDLKAKAVAKKSPNGPPLFPKPPVSVLMNVLEDLRALNYTDKATKVGNYSLCGHFQSSSFDPSSLCVTNGWRLC